MGVIVMENTDNYTGHDVVMVLWKLGGKVKELRKLEEKQESFEASMRMVAYELERVTGEFEELVCKAKEIGLDLGRDKWGPVNELWGQDEYDEWKAWSDREMKTLHKIRGGPFKRR